MLRDLHTFRIPLMLSQQLSVFGVRAFVPGGSGRRRVHLTSMQGSGHCLLTRTLLCTISAIFVPIICSTAVSRCLLRCGLRPWWLTLICVLLLWRKLCVTRSICSPPKRVLSSQVSEVEECHDALPGQLHRQDAKTIVELQVSAIGIGISTNRRCHGNLITQSRAQTVAPPLVNNSGHLAGNSTDPKLDHPNRP